MLISSGADKGKISSMISLDQLGEKIAYLVEVRILRRRKIMVLSRSHASCSVRWSVFLIAVLQPGRRWPAGVIFGPVVEIELRVRLE